MSKSIKTPELLSGGREGLRNYYIELVAYLGLIKRISIPTHCFWYNEDVGPARNALAPGKNYMLLKRKIT